MTTINDVVFAITCIVWLISGIACWYIFGSEGITYANMGMLLLTTILIVVKSKNDKFYNWLEKDLKNNNTVT